MKSFYIPKATSPSRRNLVLLCKKHLNKKPLLKNKTVGLKNSNGRNNSGKITVRHKGGGNKKNYRKIDFLRINNTIGIVCSIEYDPNRKSFIASVYDSINIKFFYILAPDGLKIGDIVKSGDKAYGPYIGYSTPLSNMPGGSYIHNISVKQNKKSQISRAAGTFSKLKEIDNKKNNEWSQVSLRSGKHIIIPSNCFATIGVVSNGLYFLSQLGKAGQSRWLNRRPSVRGVAMNPVDHPHGGGEGKKSGKGKTPWGKNVLRGKTSRSKNKFIIKENSEKESKMERS